MADGRGCAAVLEGGPLLEDSAELLHIDGEGGGTECVSLIALGTADGTVEVVTVGQGAVQPLSFSPVSSFKVSCRPTPTRCLPIPSHSQAAARAVDRHCSQGRCGSLLRVGGTVHVGADWDDQDPVSALDGEHPAVCIHDMHRNR